MKRDRRVKPLATLGPASSDEANQHPPTAFRLGGRRFALTSSIGADPRSRFPYLRTKGELEVAVRDLGWPSLTIVRPGPILGERDGTRTGERILEMALKTLHPVLPKRMRGNPADRIARTLLEAAITGPNGSRVVEAAEIG